MPALRAEMPAVINAGGSLTGAVILVFIAWGVRKLREVQQKHQEEQQKRKSIALEGPGRFFVEFSLEALKLLVGRAGAGRDERTGRLPDRMPRRAAR